MYPIDSQEPSESSRQDFNSDLFYTTACLYSEGQLSLEVATISLGLTKEEFLEKIRYSM